jgi:hypothetical protein
LKCVEQVENAGQVLVFPGRGEVRIGEAVEKLAERNPLAVQQVKVDAAGIEQLANSGGCLGRNARMVVAAQCRSVTSSEIFHQSAPGQ